MADLPQWQIAGAATPSMPLTLEASTGAAGSPLQNGTPNFIAWTAPNDGQLHRVIVLVSLIVTALETGGACRVQVTGASPTLNVSIAVSGQAAGRYNAANPFTLLLQPGDTVTVQQSAALTAGAATLFAEIWGS